MYGALCLVLLCFYKIVQITFYTISAAFLVLNWAIKITDWSLDLIRGLWKALVYIVTTSVTVEKKLTYAYGFCSTEQKKITARLRNPGMHS